MGWTGAALAALALGAGSAMGFRRAPLRMAAGVPSVHRMENPAQGCVLLAPKEEYNHFLREAAVFVYEWDSFADDVEPMARGVIVDRATGFDIGEMAPPLQGTPLGANRLYSGGEAGENAVIMLHQHGEVVGSRPLGNGLFVGGVAHAQELVGSGAFSASDFKFFFNHCSWTRRQVQEMIDGGGWTVAWAPKDLILRQETNKAWNFIRSSLISQAMGEKERANVVTPSALADGSSLGDVRRSAAPKSDISINIGGAADEDEDDIESDDSLYDFSGGPTAMLSMVQLRMMREDAMRKDPPSEDGPFVPTHEDDPSLYESLTAFNPAQPRPGFEQMPDTDNPFSGGAGI
mmetsp:Transcript_17098/g.52508  ORF Transcript_17098/g.52508 Transcript_17098/m.52508 type:complete len:347 (-) Transcript_17098:153-1193(-)